MGGKAPEGAPGLQSQGTVFKSMVSVPAEPSSQGYQSVPSPQKFEKAPAEIENQEAKTPVDRQATVYKSSVGVI